MMNVLLVFIKNCLSPLKQYILLVLFKTKWRVNNSHNLTQAKSIFPIKKVSVGNATYGSLDVRSYGNDNEFLQIGNYCSIAGEVLFVLSGGHNYKRCSNYPFPKIPYDICNDSTTNGPIIVEDDVWIGIRVTILSGVRLGKGCVIGAGSIVTKDVPPYAIFARGKIIKYRFSKDLIDKVSRIDFSKIDTDTLKNYKKYCQDMVNIDNINEILEIFDV